MVTVLLALAVTLGTPAVGERSVTTVDPRGEARVEVAFQVPISDIQQLWRPQDKVPFQDRKWWISFDSAPQQDIPFISYFNLAERNRFLFGSESLEWDNRVESKINQEKGVYEVRLTVVAGPDGRLTPFKVTLDRRDIPWTDALGEWRDGLSYPKGAYPDAAWKPVYCSWYAVHAAVTQDWTERTAAIASDLGFKTFILDDGWSYDEMKRVNPETIKTWYRDTGRWDAFSPVKFPDFRAHRERMRKLGLKYIVWVAPYFVGTRSPAFVRWGFDKKDEKPFEGNVLADLRNAALMDDITRQLTTLLRESDLDGLKIDFFDYIRASADNPQGAMSLAYIRRLMGELRKIKPEGIFEYRQSYATPATAALATQFRAGDVPYEWLSNLQRICQIRLTMGDRIPVHADPIYWSDVEADENVDRHFMASMAGVPMLSMDLEKMPKSRRDVVRAWLGYYTAHVERFHRGGTWRIDYRNGGLACATARLGDEALFIVNDAAAFPKARAAANVSKIVVLNLSFEELRLADGTVIPAAGAYPARDK